MGLSIPTTPSNSEDSSQFSIEVSVPRSLLEFPLSGHRRSRSTIDKAIDLFILNLSQNIKQVVRGGEDALSARNIKPLYVYSKYWKDELLQNISTLIRLRTEEDRRPYFVDCFLGILKKDGYLFSTEKYSTEREISGAGWAIFVIGHDDRLLCESHERGVFQHSSFFAGGCVAAAGEIRVKGGLLLELSNQSGHYRPSGYDNYYMLKYFSQKGVDLSEVKYTEYYQDEVRWFGKASDRLVYLERLPPSVTVTPIESPRGCINGSDQFFQ